MGLAEQRIRLNTWFCAVLSGLDMAIPLYPGPPSFELGLEVTGVGIFFDGKGLGSLLKVMIMDEVLLQYVVLMN
jgi:hypothetical protein